MTVRPQYLRVRSWEKYQHYKDRRPPWIKYHVEMLDDYELTHLPYVTQLLFDRLLLLAARTDNNIPHDPEWVATQTHIAQALVRKSLETLVTAKFLTVSDGKRAASTALAKRKPAASPRALARGRGREEAKAETEKSKSATQAVPVARPLAPVEPISTAGFKIPQKAIENRVEGAA